MPHGQADARALGESFGVILFASLADYERMVELSEELEETARITEVGCVMTSLSYERGADLPASLRREVQKYGWPVAAATAYPVVEHRGRDGFARAATPRELHVIAAPPPRRRRRTRGRSCSLLAQPCLFSFWKLVHKDDGPDRERELAPTSRLQKPASSPCLFPLQLSRTVSRDFDTGEHAQLARAGSAAFHEYASSTARFSWCIRVVRSAEAAAANEPYGVLPHKPASTFIAAPSDARQYELFIPKASEAHPYPPP